MHYTFKKCEMSCIHYYVFKIDLRSISSLLYKGITVGFSSTRYTVVEGGGTISVCASRLNGSLTRPLSVTFTPLPMEGSEGNATCMTVGKMSHINMTTLAYLL